MRVEPDGSVAYTCYWRVPPAENELPFIKTKDPIKYSNMKGDMISLASHMGISQATRAYDDLATKALADKVACFVDCDVLSGVMWSQLSKTARKKILRLSTFLKEKFDLLGVLIKLKARIVVERTDHCSRHPTSVFTVAAAQGRHVVTMDVPRCRHSQRGTGLATTRTSQAPVRERPVIQPLPRQERIHDRATQQNPVRMRGVGQIVVQHPIHFPSVARVRNDPLRPMRLQNHRTHICERHHGLIGVHTRPPGAYPDTPERVPQHYRQGGRHPRVPESYSSTSHPGTRRASAGNDGEVHQ